MVALLAQHLSVGPDTAAFGGGKRTRTSCRPAAQASCVRQRQVEGRHLSGSLRRAEWSRQPRQTAHRQTLCDRRRTVARECCLLYHFSHMYMCASSVTSLPVAGEEDAAASCGAERSDGSVQHPARNERERQSDRHRKLRHDVILDCEACVLTGAHCRRVARLCIWQLRTITRTSSNSSSKTNPNSSASPTPCVHFHFHFRRTCRLLRVWKLKLMFEYL